jgi:hypothetical protein
MAVMGRRLGDTIISEKILKSTDLKIHTRRTTLTAKRKINEKIFCPLGLFG